MSRTMILAWMPFLLLCGCASIVREPVDVAAAICLVDAVLTKDSSTPSPPQPEPQDETKTCPTCNGSGTNGRTTCPTCNGSGKVKADFIAPVIPDSSPDDDQRIAFGTYEQFYEESARNPGQYYILISAEWCGPCQILKSQLAKLKQRATVWILDVDRQPAIGRRYLEGRTMPTLFRIDVASGGIVRSRVYWDRRQPIEEFIK